MKKRKDSVPRCLVIAGPNGAGKTTFAREYLPGDARVLNFINADLIAAGLSPLKPQLAAMAAARLVLQQMDHLAESRADFAFESTLSGLGPRIPAPPDEAGGISRGNHLPAHRVTSTCHQPDCLSGAPGWARRPKVGNPPTLFAKLEEFCSCLPPTGMRGLYMTTRHGHRP